MKQGTENKKQQLHYNLKNKQPKENFETLKNVHHDKIGNQAIITLLR